MSIPSEAVQPFSSARRAQTWFGVFSKPHFEGKICIKLMRKLQAARCTIYLLRWLPVTISPCSLCNSTWIKSWQVVLAFTPEIHFVVDSTMIGSSTVSGLTSKARLWAGRSFSFVDRSPGLLLLFRPGFGRLRLLASSLSRALFFEFELLGMSGRFLLLLLLSPSPRSLSPTILITPSPLWNNVGFINHKGNRNIQEKSKYLSLHRCIGQSPVEIKRPSNFLFRSHSLEILSHFGFKSSFEDG